MKTVKRLFITSIIIFTLLGCEGGSNSTTSTNQTNENNNSDNQNVKYAHLVDSNISGVYYETNSYSGLTDKNGSFKYSEDDKIVLFKVGEIALSEYNLSKLNTDTIIYPTDLANVDRTNINHPNVIKLLRFLQSIDEDTNTSNGINISKSLQDKFTTSFHLLDDNITNNYIENELNNKEIIYINESEAIKHFKKTLKISNIMQDTPPTFNDNDFSPTISENNATSLNFSATDDEDSWIDLSFSLSGKDSEYFSITSNTGTVNFISAPDYETKQNYFFTITVTDSANNSVSKNVNITITNINTTGTILHNNVYYSEVTSPYTGKVWLDRNLGADRICQSYNDISCYGDYYQWGRSTDGHEKSFSDTINDTNTTITDVLNLSHNKFIKTSLEFDYDWTKGIDQDGTIRKNSWSKIDGTSICPVGFRVPTKNELEAETLTPGNTTLEKAYQSFLKLPATGNKSLATGTLFFKGEKITLWSNDTLVVWGDNKSTMLSIHNGISLPSSTYNIGRGNGYSIRCIKD